MKWVVHIADGEIVRIRRDLVDHHDQNVYRSGGWYGSIVANLQGFDG